MAAKKWENIYTKPWFFHSLDNPTTLIQNHTRHSFVQVAPDLPDVWTMIGSVGFTEKLSTQQLGKTGSVWVFRTMVFRLFFRRFVWTADDSFNMRCNTLEEIMAKVFLLFVRLFFGVSTVLKTHVFSGMGPSARKKLQCSYKDPETYKAPHLGIVITGFWCFFLSFFVDGKKIDDWVDLDAPIKKDHIEKIRKVR